MRLVISRVYGSVRQCFQAKRVVRTPRMFQPRTTSIDDSGKIPKVIVHKTPPKCVQSEEPAKICLKPINENRKHLLDTINPQTIVNQVVEPPNLIKHSGTRPRPLVTSENTCLQASVFFCRACKLTNLFCSNTIF